MHYNVGRLIEDPSCITRNFYAPRRVRSTEYFTPTAAHFGWVVIDSPDDIHGVFFAKEFRDGSSNGAYSILYRTNFLFHGHLRFVRARSITAWKFSYCETISVLEFATPGNWSEEVRREVVTGPRFGSCGIVAGSSPGNA